MDRIAELRVGHRVNPLGIPGTPPFLSFRVEGDGAGKTYGVEVAETEAALAAGEVSWRASGFARPFLVVDGLDLVSRSRWWWRVVGSEGRTSDAAVFEVGLTRPEDWSAKWIAAPKLAFARESWDPAPYLRKELAIEAEQIASARVYVTALGLYRLYVNGVELTEQALLRPGWTDYARRVYHQTYDCAALLAPGANTIGVVLAKGWYAGRLGLQYSPGYYGDRPALRLQAEITDRGGRRHTIASDGTWRCGHGAILASDLLRGESQDRRLEPNGWNRNGFGERGVDGAPWEPVEIVEREVEISPQPHDSVAVHQIRSGKLVHQQARGASVFDFGQNLVGWVRLHTPMTPGVEVIVRHGEVLTPDRTVYRDNLRAAFQEDHFTSGVPERQRLEPSFTVHGFRYAEVWGLPLVNPDLIYELNPDVELEAVAIATPQAVVGRFETSHQLLNRLADAIVWTIRNNFIEVATDCPQRDERLGWLGDAGVIADTAAYNLHVAAFFAKFLEDVADAQAPDGALRDFVPTLRPSSYVDGAPGWSDGYVRILWLLVERYGDLAVAERHYARAAAFLDSIERRNPSGLRERRVGVNWGDWLSLPAGARDDSLHPAFAYTGAHSTSSKRVVATAHYYRSLIQMAEIAQRLGRDADGERYRSRAERVRSIYRETFIAADGTIEGDTQTAYAQAIGYGLVADDECATLADRLASLIERTGYLTTGIHGVSHVLPALARHGHAELAYRMLLRDEHPSWLYMIAAGGTTIWEKWDAIRPDGSFAQAEMNSFNHYALGAVGSFLYEDVAGIGAGRSAWTDVVELRPRYTTALEWVRASHDGAAGGIESRWHREGDRFVHEIEVSGGLEARVTLHLGATVETGRREDGSRSVLLPPGRHTVFTPLVSVTGSDRRA